MYIVAMASRCFRALKITEFETRVRFCSNSWLKPHAHTLTIINQCNTCLLFFSHESGVAPKSFDWWSRVHKTLNNTSHVAKRWRSMELYTYIYIYTSKNSKNCQNMFQPSRIFPHAHGKLPKIPRLSPQFIPSLQSYGLKESGFSITGVSYMVWSLNQTIFESAIFHLKTGQLFVGSKEKASQNHHVWTNKGFRCQTVGLQKTAPTNGPNQTGHPNHTWLGARHLSSLTWLLWIFEWGMVCPILNIQSLMATICYNLILDSTS